MEKKHSNWEKASWVASAIALFIAILALASCTPKVEEQEVPKWSAVELLKGQHPQELSDFDKLTLALALTESRFNPNADSGAGDFGLLQLRSIYLAEVNRLYKTNYTIEDAFDIDKSIEIFRLMQSHYNPDGDIETAIFFHNKSSAYKAKALQNYELICRMEEVRAKLIAQ